MFNAPDGVDLGAFLGRPVRLSLIDQPDIVLQGQLTEVSPVVDQATGEAIASSLTELFAPNLHEERIAGMLKHYDFINPSVMTYFQRRLEQAPRDAGFALDFVRQHAHGVTAARGGEGAAREFCELIMRAQGSLDAALDAYL